MLKRLVMILVLSLVVVAPTYAFDLDKMLTFKDRGVRAYYAVDSLSLLGCENDDADYTWSSIGYMMSKPVYSWLNVQPIFGVGAISTKDHTAPGLEGRLMFDLHKGIFYFKVGGGFATYLTRDEFDSLHNSVLYGLISGEAGIRFKSGMKELRIGVVQEHISSPFHSDDDSGINVFGPAISGTF